jgi:hypothetical protein
MSCIKSLSKFSAVGYGSSMQSRGMTAEHLKWLHLREYDSSNAELILHNNTCCSA